MNTSKSTRGLGFRNFEEFNLAFLAKIGWNIIQNPNAIWVRLLKACIFQDIILLMPRSIIDALGFGVVYSKEEYHFFSVLEETLEMELTH
ncbi:hypothetical protein LINPERPRIM_LOCUS5296 [Linum perenne]